jgi:HD superfamily phosphohydrolase
LPFVAIRDPIHGSIAIEPWAMPILDSSAFQRLRRVHQLGTAHLVYPGAHHSRFEHSLGAYHLAGRFAKTLGLDDAAAGTLRAAALLHDVGHGPFSHAFDELLREQGRRHEEASVDLVRWGPLGDPLRQGGLDPVAVGNAILGQGPLAPLVSGSLDADRIDYLLRDAHYTGVRSSVDADRLTEVVERDEKHGLVLQESGVIAAEALLSTRFLMYPAVYLHHTVRSSESMLQAAIRLHVADGHAALRDLERETDDALLARLRAGGKASADLVRRLDERRLYKRAFEGRPDAPNAKALLRLADEPAKRRRIEAEISHDAGVAPESVLLDVPHPPRFREAGLGVRQRDGSVRTLSQASRLVAVLHEARMDHWRSWVFAPKNERERVAGPARRVLEAIS